ncbi:MAG TPA: excinuclease ABC subunit UvrC [Hyphomonadaceae bacterium]|jgi:excinuclease ABC subunit C|nr:excinuclease ABC subunit UvrC [Hyphomonadaceae bacterium]
MIIPDPPENEPENGPETAGAAEPEIVGLADDAPDEEDIEVRDVTSESQDEPAPAGPRLLGPDVIRDNLKRLPGKPGVYRMFGEGAELLYVGKARNLKARVGSYAKLGGHTQRIARMISLTRTMEFVVTASETEALLLEANLIKRLKPRFNIILRDDKSFPHILIREDHEAPQALKHRGAKKIKGQYFGPFASAGAVDQTLDTLQKVFLLRTCTDNIYATRSRPCMLHQMGRCSAPCTGLIPLDEYRDLVREAERFLNGDAETLMEQLAEQMDRAAQSEDYERAARLRDRIRALAAVRQSQSVNPEGLVEADVFAIHCEAGQSAVQAFFFRAGQNWGATVWYPKHDREDTQAQILSAFLAQFYDDRPVPKMILLSHDIEEVELITEALELKADHKVEIRTPQRGEKLRIVDQALLNAREALGRKLAETQSQAKIFAAVQKVFDLPELPKRIEVYDNSHIMGTNMVGGMIVAGPEGFEKNAYRKFNIKDETIEPGDDFGMMREVMRRRFGRLKKEQEEIDALYAAEAEAAGALPSPPKAGEVAADPQGQTTDGDAPSLAAPESARRRADAWPDLVLIDGGLGQLSAVREAIAEVGFKEGELNLVAIAKGPDRNAGREQFFRPGRQPFQLPPNDPALYYLQRLRDEAHRWAIGAHRTKRAAANFGQNPLDEIQGIGQRRKKALLSRFGSAKGVSNATAEDLATVEGVNASLAQRIYDHFHGG